MDHKVSKDMISSGMIPSGEKTQADLGRTQYGSAPSPNSLFDAYKSIYEHHQKDKDGNTIPHEDEEVNEGKIPAGLQAYLDKKKGKKEDKKDVKEESIDEALPLVPLIAKGAAMLGKVGAAAGKVGAAAAKTGVKMAAKSKIPGATNVVKSVARDPMGAVNKAADLSYKAQMVGSMLPKPKPRTSGSGGGVTGGMSQTVSADVDLFDIVKGQLLDEGLSEEEIRDIMLTLTPDEILNEISGELAMKASKAADMKRSELARSGDRAGAADKAAQASRLYKKGAERNIAKQDLSKPLNPQRKDYPMGKGANYQQKPGM